jgi:hypothetical protein
MKIIITHDSPDLDGITSIWLIRKFLPGWNEAKVGYVPAGERLSGAKGDKVIEEIGADEVIHVDTGLSPLDHHETGDQKVCAASLTWDYVRSEFEKSNIGEGEKWDQKKKALDRLVKIIVDIDHFKEVFWGDPTADFHEFNLVNILEGYKSQFPNQNEKYVEFVITNLEAILHQFEAKIWAEEEIKNGKEFETKFGKALALDSVNDSAVKLAQKMGYVIAMRKDPRKGYLRIKARPGSDVDLTQVYEKLKKMDPDATWFLHASKKMLLNGSAKNPKMRPTKLNLDAIISVLKNI